MEQHSRPVKQRCGGDRAAAEEAERSDDTEEPTAAQLMSRRRAGGRTVGIVNEEERKPKSKPAPPPPPPPPTRPSLGTSGAAMSVSGRQVQLLRRMSTVEMVVHNEDGETEEVEIDVAEEEARTGRGGGSGRSSASGSTISERINRRRNSELAADIIRLSAAHRRREFAQLLDEHRTIVRQLEGLGGDGGGGPSGKPANQRPPPVGTIPECSVDKDKENMDFA